MDIARFLPDDEYNAAVGANAPSASNVFATIADLSSFITSNVYTANGNLTSNRTVQGVFGTNYNFAFQNLGTFTLGSQGDQGFVLQQGNFIVSNLGAAQTISMSASGVGSQVNLAADADLNLDVLGTGQIRLRNPGSGGIILADGTEGTIGHVWTQSAITGEGSWSALPADANTNIYTNDGSLAGNRLVSMNNFDLRFDITGGFTPLALDNDGVGGCKVGIGIAAPLVDFHVATATRFSNLTTTAVIGHVLTATSVNGDVDWAAPAVVDSLQTYIVSNDLTLRTIDANAINGNNLRDLVCTLIRDLNTAGVLTV